MGTVTATDSLSLTDLENKSLELGKMSSFIRKSYNLTSLFIENVVS